MTSCFPEFSNAPAAARGDDTFDLSVLA